METVVDETPVTGQHHMAMEMLANQDLAAVMSKCPFLGRLSVEQAGLLLEMHGERQAAVEEAEPVTDSLASDEHAPVKSAEEADYFKPAVTIVEELPRLQQQIVATPSDELAPALMQEIFAADRSEAADEAAVSPASIDVTAPQSAVVVAPEAAQTDMMVIKEETASTDPVTATALEPIVISTGPKERPAVAVVAPVSPVAAIEEVEQLSPVVAPAEILEQAPAPVEIDEVVLVEQDETPVTAEAEVAMTPVVEIDRDVHALPPVEVVAEPVTNSLELAVPAERIDASIDQIVEAMDQADEASERVHEIMQEIVSLPTEAAKDEIEGIEVDRRLEELFTELFEAAELEYTPELVASLVALTKMHHFEQRTMIALEAEEEIERLPKEIGTREFLQKLQRAIRTVGRTAGHWFEIGQSIMRLYGLRPATESLRA